MACVRSPGRLVPDDLAPIAQHLNVNASKFALDVLEWHDGGWRPRLTPDGCVFLKNQRCSIHAVKPYECREATHDLTLDEVRAIDEHVKREWWKYEHDQNA